MTVKTVYGQLVEEAVALTDRLEATVTRAPSNIVPPFLLTSIVSAYGKTPDGDLVTLVEPAWAAILTLLANDPSARFQIPWRKWEELIAASYDAAGFDQVTLTPGSGDGGRDVIATKSGFASVRILDQVKAFGPDRLVDANDLRAMLGVLGSDHNASKAIVTTTAKFAPLIHQDPSIAPYMPYRLQLVDGDDLVPRLMALRNSKPGR